MSALSRLTGGPNPLMGAVSYFSTYCLRVIKHLRATRSLLSPDLMAPLLSLVSTLGQPFVGYRNVKTYSTGRELEILS